MANRARQQLNAGLQTDRPTSCNLKPQRSPSKIEMERNQYEWECSKIRKHRNIPMTGAFPKKQKTEKYTCDIGPDL